MVELVILINGINHVFQQFFSGISYSKPLA